jgi:hypothetical protein
VDAADQGPLWAERTKGNERAAVRPGSEAGSAAHRLTFPAQIVVKATKPARKARGSSHRTVVFKDHSLGMVLMIGRRLAWPV